MADALIWHLIRDNHSFLVKRGRTNRVGSIQFSSEPGNLLNVNTFKYSGIANSKIIAVGSDLSLTTKVEYPLEIIIYVMSYSMIIIG